MLTLSLGATVPGLPVLAGKARCRTLAWRWPVALLGFGIEGAGRGAP